jgi:hypothetical protein
MGVMAVGWIGASSIATDGQYVCGHSWWHCSVQEFIYEPISKLVGGVSCADSDIDCVGILGCREGTSGMVILSVFLV